MLKSCPHCFRYCKSDAGLTRHINAMHLVASPSQQKQAERYFEKHPDVGRPANIEEEPRNNPQSLANLLNEEFEQIVHCSTIERLETYIQDRERLARIDELSHVQLEHGNYMTQTFFDGQSLAIKERIKELRKEAND